MGSRTASGRASAADQHGHGRPSTVYGPVHSWRFGSSLGVDPLLSDSICSFDCVYCQLGRINEHTRERAVFVPTEWMMEDLARSDWKSADVITFSGSGEPTLAANLGEMIRYAHESTGKPVVVLTNASLLRDVGVRRDLAGAEHVSCKIDAATEERFQLVNRPIAGISLAGVIGGITSFRKGFRGRLSIQLMLLPATLPDLSAFAPVLAAVAPDEVFVNVPSREAPASWALSSRGSHLSFDAPRAQRFLAPETVREFAEGLAARTGLRVLTAPVSAAAGEIE